MALARWPIWGGLAFSLGCSSTTEVGGAATLHACSPLEATTSSVTLEAAGILAAGRSADGTAYVITRENSKLRLFVSQGESDAVVERPAAGTGEAHDSAATTWLFDYADADGTPVSVEVLQDGAGLSMAVLKGPKPEGAKTWDLAQGELLSLLPAAEAAALPATSGQSFYVDYEGARADGRVVVVIAPEHFGSYDDFRLFWGFPTDLQERAIRSFTRTRSSTTSLQFDTGSGSAMLSYSFPFPLPDTAGMSQGSLSLGEQTESLSGAAPPALPDGARFSCR